MKSMGYSFSEYKLDIYKMSLQQLNLMHNTYEGLRNNIFSLINHYSYSIREIKEQIM